MPESISTNEWDRLILGHLVKKTFWESWNSPQKIKTTRVVNCNNLTCIKKLTRSTKITKEWIVKLGIPLGNFKSISGQTLFKNK